MTEPLSLLTALILGLLGSAHCLGMCGGIAAAIALGNHQLRHLAAYNLGRLFSYSLAGALAGSVGLVAADGFWPLLLRTLAGLMLIAMGLYVANWWKGLVYLEQLGSRLWALIQPAASRLLPVKNSRQALMLGFFWGWLPCGLVYSTLIWSATAQDTFYSSTLMLAFGIGTLPAMLTTGLLAQQVNQILKNTRVQQSAGILIILFGLYSIPFPGLASL